MFLTFAVACILARPQVTTTFRGLSIGAFDYIYKVQAIGDKTASKWSKKSLVIGGELSQNGYVEIQWQPIAGATQYKVYRTLDTDTNNVGLIGKTAATSFDDTGLIASPSKVSCK